jgi:hypothetical protein
VPPLEINQSRYINASVRLDEPIAAQFAQYAAFTRASADDFVDKALKLCLIEGLRRGGLSQVAAGQTG